MPDRTFQPAGQAAPMLAVELARRTEPLSRWRLTVLDSGRRTTGPINAHPMVNTMTTAFALDDLLHFIEDTGHRPLWLAFPL